AQGRSSNCIDRAMRNATVVLPFVPVTPLTRRRWDGVSNHRLAICPSRCARSGTATVATPISPVVLSPLAVVLPHTTAAAPACTACSTKSRPWLLAPRHARNASPGDTDRLSVVIPLIPTGGASAIPASSQLRSRAVVFARDIAARLIYLLLVAIA